MLTINTNPVLLAAINLFLCNTCYAQALNDSSVLGCSPPISTIVNGHLPFNSTGTFRLDPGSAFDDPWYLSITITDRRGPNYVHGDSLTWQERETFLSVPDSLTENQHGSQTQYCMYTLPSLDVRNQEEHGSCIGALSNACIEHVQYNTPTMLDNLCPRPYELTQICGSYGEHVIGSPRNFSSTECTLTRLPNVDLPERYRTYAYMSTAIRKGGDDREGYDAYDRHVKEAVPTVFTIKAPDGTIETKVVCLAPDNVVEGSRIPPESAASHLRSGPELKRASVSVALVSILSFIL
ncbi:hypothetical protein AA0114_g1646 [Alternaria tenuissima]|uniref:Uncharacterized protein n=1 Tax=Alternaria tenuissima TaxID=119927 RepID=A0A4Q4MU39_9PLEO|nr:hypothetical protein AA0114_g1646 [Alternaria tenuissima]